MADGGLDDLQAVIDHVRAGDWLRPGRSVNLVVAFVAGYTAARPGASIDELAGALRAAEIDPSMVHAAHTTFRIV
jgi:hypothetical protein